MPPPVPPPVPPPSSCADVALPELVRAIPTSSYAILAIGICFCWCFYPYECQPREPYIKYRVDGVVSFSIPIFNIHFQHTLSNTKY